MSHRWYQKKRQGRTVQQPKTYEVDIETTPPPTELICPYCAKRVTAEEEIVLGKKQLKDMRNKPCPRCGEPLIPFKHYIDSLDEPF